MSNLSDEYIKLIKLPEYIESALEECPEKYKGEARDLIKTYIYYKVAAWYGGDVARDDKKYLEYVIRAFSYKDVIKSFEIEVAKDVARCVGDVARYDKERLEDVVDLLKLYVNSEVAGNVARCVKEVARYDKERLEDVVDLLKLYVNSEAAGNVAECVKEVARYDKERLEDVVGAFSRYKDVIMSFKKEAAGNVAECVRVVAQNDKERLKDVVDLLKLYVNSEAAGNVAECVRVVAQNDKERVKDVVDLLKLYVNSEAAGNVAECVRVVAQNDKERVKDVVDLLKIYVNSEATRDVTWYVRDIAWGDKERLKDVIGTFKTLLEGPEAYRKYQKEMLKKVVPDIQDDFFKYEKSYVISDIGAAKEANEKANEDLYESGLEIIRGIADGKIAVELDWEHPEVLEQFLGDSAKEIVNNIYKIKGSENTAKEMKKRLKENKGNDTEAKNWLEDYESRKKGVENEAREILREKLKAEYEILKQEIPEQNYDIEKLKKLKEYLNQFSQHFLGKGTAPAKQAKAISSSLVVNEGKLSSNVAKIYVWEKSLNTKEMPTYEEFHCCAFNRGEKDINVNLFNYVINPTVQLLKFEIGDKSAMAIVAATKDENGEKVLLLDSFESGKHIFARKGVAKAALEAIKDYAKAAGFKKVVISADAGNNAPREFYKSIDGDKSEISLELITKAPWPYLEALRGDGKVRGKVFDPGAAEA
jgi:hypothetical protein